MSTHSMKGKTIAILATDGYEQSELTEPKRLLEAAGAKVHVLAPEKTREEGEILGWNHTDWGTPVAVDRAVNKANAADYDGLVLPGGQMNPDKLRIDADAMKFIKSFGATDKPIAAICHGPWTLIEAGLVKGKKVTSWPSLKIDLTNAGAKWEDSQVVVDGSLITSRKPDDIPAFTNAFMEAVVSAEETA